LQKESLDSWLSVEKRARYFKVPRRFARTRFALARTPKALGSSAVRQEHEPAPHAVDAVFIRVLLKPANSCY
jgi:hypothetical protein